MGKSFIDEALRKNPGTPAVNTGDSNVPPMPGADDIELEEILQTLKVRIKIFGCGGGGSNTISRLSEEGVVGAEMFAVNTDAAHLLAIHAPRKMLIGRRCTKGLGAGALPEVGEQAAKETEDELKKTVQDTDIVFVTCGLGGGTGTGSAPVIAKLAREAGAMVIAVVTVPFRSEGNLRMLNAVHGLERLRSSADTVIVVPNDKLLSLVPKLPLNQAFKVADEVLMHAIKGITEIVTRPGLVNLDYSDLKTVMKGSGLAMIGIGESSDDDRAAIATNEALASPLLDVKIDGAMGALINVTGGPDMTVAEAEKVAEIVGQRISQNARIIWGCRVEPDFEKNIRVMLVVTGLKEGPNVMKGTAAGAMDTHLDMVR
jgi:cell division protein FtsZ